MDPVVLLLLTIALLSVVLWLILTRLMSRKPDIAGPGDKGFSTHQPSQNEPEHHGEQSDRQQQQDYRVHRLLPSARPTLPRTGLTSTGFGIRLRVGPVTTCQIGACRIVVWSIWSLSAIANSLGL